MPKTDGKDGPRKGMRPMSEALAEAMAEIRKRAEKGAARKRKPAGRAECPAGLAILC